MSDDIIARLREDAADQGIQIIKLAADLRRSESKRREAEQWRAVWKARYKSLVGQGGKSWADSMSRKLGVARQENAELRAQLDAYVEVGEVAPDAFHNGYPWNHIRTNDDDWVAHSPIGTKVYAKEKP